ncbi:MAG TPA: hypothetical protein PKD48_01820 [Sphingopyxis sp.]|nr:hypothetical protein [Sphingopyxis sp.]
MTWHPTNYRKPRTSRKLRVRFRNGDESKHSYAPDHLRWSDTGSDFDVIEARIEEE